MSESKHTPAPWAAKPLERRAVTKIVGANAGPVCEIDSLDPLEPDTLLILAAPGMLAALEAVLSCYDEARATGRAVTLTGDKIAAARAALAKARGEGI